MTVTENRTELPSSDGISEQASRNTLALNPLVGITGQDLADSAGVLFKAMINEPKVAAEQWLSFLGELGRQVRACAEGRRQAVCRSGMEGKRAAQRIAQSLPCLGRGGQRPR
jgi:hypothetical protein